MKRDTVIAFPADEHAGSPVGLLPGGQWSFVNGGYHNPDTTQRMITRLWVDSWEKVAKARKGKRLVIVNVGDAVEGMHHNTTQVITPRVDEHERMHIASMGRALDIVNFDEKKGDLLYYVGGTPSHVGQGGQSEERIARDLGAVPMVAPTLPDGEDGTYLWPRLLLDVNEKLFDIAHHGAGMGTRPWTRSNPMRGKLQSVYFEAMERGSKPPNVWIRAHRHVKVHDIFMSSTGLRIDGFVTPAFQSKTEFGYKVAGDMLASMGLLWFDISAAGQIQDHWNLLEFDPDQVVKL